jgi:hypothetical protein
MAHDWPDVPEILRTVREFIDGVTPRLAGLDRYHALCAIYLIEIAERELAGWEAPPTAADERLRELAGIAPEDGRQAITSLCRRIRAGELEDRMDELLEALTAHVVAKVRVSKPAVLDPVHRDA